jgi:hypothetical protein
MAHGIRRVGLDVQAHECTIAIFDQESGGGASSSAPAFQDDSRGDEVLVRLSASRRVMSCRMFASCSHDRGRLRTGASASQGQAAPRSPIESEED